MPVPFVIDNIRIRLSETLKGLLDQSAGKPLDIATAYFSISGYKIVKDGLHKLGAFRLLLGSDPHNRGPTWDSRSIRGLSRPGSRATSKRSRSPRRP